MSEIKREEEIPRRARVDLWCDAEKAIQAAVDAVEAMPADVRLTDAVTQLWEARQSVADYVDGVPRRVPAVVQERDTLARRVAELEAFVRQVQTWPSDDIQGVRYHAYQLLVRDEEAERP